MNLRTENVDCCVCGSAARQPLCSGWDFEYATTHEEFFFQECTACGHTYLSPRPTLEELPRIYPPDYYAYDLKESINSLALKVKHSLERRKVRKYLSYIDSHNPVCLDIGCGDGRSLDMLRAEGLPTDHLWGVELDDDVIERLDHKGYKARKGPIESCDLPKEQFDLIIMLQVIEHVSQPQELMGAIRDLLAPGGVLILETPNVQSLDARIFRRRYWGGYHFPRHWNLFSSETLSRLGQTAGLESINIETFVCAVFWIFPFHHWLRERGAPRFVYRFFWPMSNPLLLAIATAIDIPLAPLGRTSNLRGVFRRKPSNS